MSQISQSRIFWKKKSNQKMFKQHSFCEFWLIAQLIGFELAVVSLVSLGFFLPICNPVEGQTLCYEIRLTIWEETSPHSWEWWISPLHWAGAALCWQPPQGKPPARGTGPIWALRCQVMELAWTCVTCMTNKCVVHVSLLGSPMKTSPFYCKEKKKDASKNWKDAFLQICCKNGFILNGWFIILGAKLYLEI